MADTKTTTPTTKAIAKVPVIRIQAIVHHGSTTAMFSVICKPQTLGDFVQRGMLQLALATGHDYTKLVVQRVGLERAEKMVLSLDQAEVLAALDKQVSDVGFRSGDIVHVSLK